jgi:hypothetical protein
MVVVPHVVFFSLHDGTKLQVVAGPLFSTIGCEDVRGRVVMLRNDDARGSLGSGNFVSNQVVGDPVVCNV